MVIGKALQGNKPPLSCSTRRSCVQRPRRSLHETHASNYFASFLHHSGSTWTCQSMSTWSVTQLNESSPGIITSGALFVIFYLIPPHPSPLFRAPWYFVERKRAFPDLPLPNPNWLRKVCSFKLCKIYPLTHKLLQLCNWVVTFATFVDSATGNLSSRPAFPLPHFLTFPACIYPLTQACKHCVQL